MERFVTTAKATQKQSSILLFAVKTSPAFVCLSLPPRSKRPLHLLNVVQDIQEEGKNARPGEQVVRGCKARADNAVKLFNAYVAHCILHFMSEKATKCDTPTREEKLKLTMTTTKSATT